MMNEIAPKLYQKMRERAGLTQTELGEAMGATRYTVSHFENGRTQLDKAQEQRLFQITQCTKIELVEMLCSVLSEWIGKPVGIRESYGAYEPTSALSRAFELLRENVTRLPAALLRALNNKINLTRLIGLAFERNNADLLELVQDCREELKKPSAQTS